MYRYAILYHNYYDLDGVQEIRRRIGKLGDRNVLLLCSLAERHADSMPRQTEHERFVISSNVGKDIGGKLILINLLLAIAPEVSYVIFLHDKRSYQKHSGEFEKDNLFSIIEPDKFDRIATSFQTNERLGIACCAGYIRAEACQDGAFQSRNAGALAAILEQYQIKPVNYSFAAGSMFWIRSRILHSFFGRFSSLKIRNELETGNPLDHEHGTLTHAWERGLSWIASAEGYTIKGF